VVDILLVEQLVVAKVLAGNDMIAPLPFDARMNDMDVGS